MFKYKRDDKTVWCLCNVLPNENWRCCDMNDAAMSQEAHLHKNTTEHVIRPW